MKKNLLILFTALTAFQLFSCKKSDPDPAPSGAAALSMTIDGTAWTASQFTATYRNSVFVLTGKSSAGETVILRMKLVAGQETSSAYYQFMYNDDVSLGVFKASDTEPELATNQYTASKPVAGTISFTTFDKTTKKVSGSFDFKVIRKTDNSEKAIKGTFSNVVYDDKAVVIPNVAMTVDLDGGGWIASTVKGVSNNSAKTLEITGTSSNGSSISLTLPYKVLTGTYNFALFGSTSASYKPTSVTSFGAETGKVTVTSHDPDAKLIKGTFFFDAYDSGSGTTKKVTNGNFTATY